MPNDARHLPTWPRRRFATALVASPVMVGALLLTSEPPATDDLAWRLILIAVAVVASSILATYVPVSGRRPDLGCTPCAAVSGLSVVAALLVIHNSGADIGGPLLALALTVAGLVQRLRQPATCVPALSPEVTPEVR